MIHIWHNEIARTVFVTIRNVTRISNQQKKTKNEIIPRQIILGSWATIKEMPLPYSPDTPRIECSFRTFLIVGPPGYHSW